MRGSMLLALAILGGVACADETSEPILFSLDVNAVDDRGGAIPGIEVHVGETAIGKTEEDGHLRARVHASDGQSFRFHAKCPGGHSSSKIPDRVVFRDTRGLEGSRTQSMKFQIRCTRNERVVALLVHAGGQAGMSVLVDGVVSGTTNAEGFAHLRLDVEPNSEFEVSLDSSAFPELLPSNPRRVLTIGDEDELVVFEPAFSTAPKPERKSRRRRRKKESAPVKKKRPVRIN